MAHRAQRLCGSRSADVGAGPLEQVAVPEQDAHAPAGGDATASGSGRAGARGHPPPGRPPFASRQATVVLMDPDTDEPRRRPITRRSALAAFGTASLGVLLEACNGDADTSVTSTPVTTDDGATATVQPQSPAGSDLAAMFDDAASCTLSPEGTEGPFYFDVDSIRTDIIEDREGTPLRLGIRVQEAGPCTAIANAVVDVWHCDANGSYSGFEAASQGGDFSGGQTDEETYLRGAQVTNADGIAEFRTVYPGWYPGRTVHIHAKVHLDSATLLTTQLYFEEGVTDAVYAEEPYASNGARTTFNDSDGIFDAATVLTVTGDGEGYLGLITIGVDR